MSEARKALLITGGTRGVGAATARLAAARGWAVCINYLRDERGATALAAEIRAAGGTVLACQADVARDADVARLFTAVTSLGTVTAVVCNARAPVTGLPIDHLDASRTARRIETAMLGSLLCSRESAIRMSTRRGATGGALVFVTPRGTRAGVHKTAEDAAINAARDALTTSLAKELRNDGIRVNAVRPAAPRVANWSGGLTNRYDRAVGPMAMELGPYEEEAAKQILWLISDEADRTTGAMIEVACRDQAE